MKQEKIRKNKSFYGLIFIVSVLFLELILYLTVDYSLKIHILFLISVIVCYVFWILLGNLED